MGHENTPPELPKIHDEAGNTPGWVPVLGVILFVTAAAAIVVCHGSLKDADDAAGIGAVQQTE